MIPFIYEKKKNTIIYGINTSKIVPENQRVNALNFWCYFFIIFRCKSRDRMMNMENDSRHITKYIKMQWKICEKDIKNKVVSCGKC